MHLFAVIFALFTITWLSVAIAGIAREYRTAKQSRWMLLFFGFLFVIGAGSFFAIGLSAIGIIKLPSSAEWPAGYVKGVATTREGGYIVPLEPQGRIQIYDSQWKFLRGWNVETGGKSFTVLVAENGNIEVYTRGGTSRCVYSQTGEMLSSDDYFSSMNPSASNQFYIHVPTAPLLWVFSSELASWGVMAVGGGGLALLRRKIKLSSSAMG